MSAGALTLSLGEARLLGMGALMASDRVAFILRSLPAEHEQREQLGAEHAAAKSALAKLARVAAELAAA